MKEKIHPKYYNSKVRCACGNEFEIGSTQKEIKVEICSKCHPLYTGKQKLIDSAGRLERFAKRFKTTSGKTVRVKAKTKAAKKETVPKKILTTGARKAKEAAPKKPAKSK